MALKPALVYNHPSTYLFTHPLTDPQTHSPEKKLFSIHVCMEPLIRKVNNYELIQGLNIGNPMTMHNLCGYADDIAFIVNSRIKHIF